jgi:hypothetical protein
MPPASPAKPQPILKQPWATPVAALSARPSSCPGNAATAYPQSQIHSTAPKPPAKPAQTVARTAAATSSRGAAVSERYASVPTSSTCAATRDNSLAAWTFLATRTRPAPRATAARRRSSVATGARCVARRMKRATVPEPPAARTAAVPAARVTYVWAGRHAARSRTCVGPSAAPQVPGSLNRVTASTLRRACAAIIRRSRSMGCAATRGR